MNWKLTKSFSMCSFMMCPSLGFVIQSDFSITKQYRLENTLMSSAIGTIGL